MKITRFAAAIVGFAVLPMPGGAAVLSPHSVVHGRPLPQQQVRTAAATSVWHTNRVGPHVVYGTIAAIKGASIRVQLRDGRVVAINAAPAIANGDFSAPLFVGKIICADGAVVAGTFAASHIFRMTSLTALPNDR